jgi:hypothetical protein
MGYFLRFEFFISIMEYRNDVVVFFNGCYPIIIFRQDEFCHEPAIPVSSPSRKSYPRGWPPARRGTILRLGEKRSLRQSFQSHDLVVRL